MWLKLNIINYNINMEDLLYITSSSLAYALYVQFNPKIGNIWIRRDSTGKRSLNLYSLYNLMGECTRNKEMWRYKNLDINYLAFTMTCYSIMKLNSNIISILS